MTLKKGKGSFTQHCRYCHRQYYSSRMGRECCDECEREIVKTEQKMNHEGNVQQPLQHHHRSQLYHQQPHYHNPKEQAILPPPPPPEIEKQQHHLHAAQKRPRGGRHSPQHPHHHQHQQQKEKEGKVKIVKNQHQRYHPGKQHVGIRNPTQYVTKPSHDVQSSNRFLHDPRQSLKSMEDDDDDDHDTVDDEDTHILNPFIKHNPVIMYMQNHEPHRQKATSTLPPQHAHQDPLKHQQQQHDDEEEQQRHDEEARQMARKKWVIGEHYPGEKRPFAAKTPTHIKTAYVQEFMDHVNMPPSKPHWNLSKEDGGTHQPSVDNDEDDSEELMTDTEMPPKKRTSFIHEQSNHHHYHPVVHQS